LAERHRIQELVGGHPVVGVGRVVLHQRDDHEPASVGERAHLECHPGERPDPTSAERRSGDYARERAQPLGQQGARRQLD
jgi:hypothetical protein